MLYTTSLINKLHKVSGRDSPRLLLRWYLSQPGPVAYETIANSISVPKSLTEKKYLSSFIYFNGMEDPSLCHSSWERWDIPSLLLCFSFLDNKAASAVAHVARRHFQKRIWCCYVHICVCLNWQRGSLLSYGIYTTGCSFFKLQAPIHNIVGSSELRTGVISPSSACHTCMSTCV